MSTLPLAQRADILSKIYAAVPMYFAHWEGLPFNYNFEKAYQDALEEGLATEDRHAFTLVAMKFIASLQNGHSAYRDDQVFGEPLGFRLKDIDGAWCVVESFHDNLPVGSVIEAIDDEPIEEFYQRHKHIIHASSEFERRGRFVLLGHVLPTNFSFTLSGGQKIPITRHAYEAPVKETEGYWIEENRIGLIEIPSFGTPQFEEDALGALHTFQNAHSIIIDIRGNGGGATPGNLVKALMDRPYRYRNTATPAIFGVYRAYANLLDVYGDQLDEGMKGYLDTFTDFKHTMLYTPAVTSIPEKPLFTGRIVILTDGSTGSAAEDFAVPFKNNGRATLVGERTMGSTGQPYIFPFKTGMSFRISSKREYFPDGSQFEGVGITPDIALAPSVEDIQAERDVVLARALELCVTGA